MASCEGRNPRIPQYDAGTLTLPPVSVPMIEKTFSLDLLRQAKKHKKFSLQKLT